MRMKRLHPIQSAAALAVAAALLAGAPARAQPLFEPEDLDQSGIIGAAEIMSAVNAAGDAGGGVVFLRASRVYLLESPLVIDRDKVTIRGEALGNIRPSGARHGVVLQMVGMLQQEAVRIENCSDSGLSNLTIVGHSGMEADAAAILLSNANGFKLENIRVSRTANGIAIRGGSRITLKRILLEQLYSQFGACVRGTSAATPNRSTLINHLSADPSNPGLDILRVGPWVRDLDIQDSRLLGGRTGLLIEGTGLADDSAPESILINQLLVQGASQDGIRIIQGRGIQLNNVVVLGGDPWPPMSGSGIVVAAGFDSRLAISNLYQRGAGQHGIAVQGGKGIQISNSMFVGNGLQAPGAGAGVWLANGVRNVLISGGRSGAYREQAGTWTQHHGIFFDGTGQQARDQSIQAMAVDTKENAIGLYPAALKWQAAD